MWLGRDDLTVFLLCGRCTRGEWRRFQLKCLFFPCSVFAKVCLRKMRNCSILARQVLTIEVTGVRKNWVGKAISLCLSFCLKTRLTHLAVPLKDPFLNCSWKIFISGASWSLMHKNFQSSIFFLWLNIKTTFGISPVTVQAHPFLPRPP